MSVRKAELRMDSFMVELIGKDRRLGVLYRAATELFAALQAVGVTHHEDLPKLAGATRQVLKHFDGGHTEYSQTAKANEISHRVVGLIQRKGEGLSLVMRWYKPRHKDTVLDVTFQIERRDGEVRVIQGTMLASAHV